MKKQILFLLIAGLIGQAIYTFNPKETYEKPLPFATHALLIFLDDSEMRIGAVGSTLMVALTQKAAPILVSTSLLASIENSPTLLTLIETEPDNELYKLTEARYTALTKRIPELIGPKSALSLKDQEQIVAQLNKEFPDMPAFDNIDNKINGATMRQSFSFNPDDWIIKVTDHEQRLLLLIPKDYTNSGTLIDLKQYKPLPKKLGINDPLTLTEYQTGLKIDHMQTVKNYTDVIPKELQPREYADYFMQAVWPRKVGANCSDIFVSNAEYSVANMQSPRWLMYADGHGQVENEKEKERSFGLTLDMFKQFLDFMDRKINTSIFVYVTCFAVGTNIQLVYQNEKGLAKAYSFIIVTQGMTDSVTMTMAGFDISNFKVADVDFLNKTLQIGPESNYPQFIRNFTTIPEIVDFGTAIAPIISVEEKREDLLEVPHIRLKGKDFFTLPDVTNKIAIIGKIFTKTCTTVNLAKYFGKKGIVPEYYLIYAPNIPCDLVISSLPNRMPYFIPMFTPEVIGDSVGFEYHIKKITAPNLSLVDIITTFSQSIPAFSYGHVQIDQLDAQTGTLVQTKENELVSFKNVNIESVTDNSNDIKFDQLMETHTKLLEEHTQLVTEQKFDEANLLMNKLNEIGNQTNKIIEQQGEPKTHINCYFMYNNMPYKFNKIGEPAEQLQEDYQDNFNKPLSKTKRFAKIKELHEKHIRLQQLEKAKAQGVAK